MRNGWKDKLVGWWFDSFLFLIGVINGCWDW